MTAELATPTQSALDICASRSDGALSAHRLLQILKGASPMGSERFCFMAVLGKSSREHRVELALAAGMTWNKFASRFRSSPASTRIALILRQPVPLHGRGVCRAIRLSA